MAAATNNIIPLPIANIDQQLGEIRAAVDMLISLGENAEEAEYLRLRGSTVCMLHIIVGKLASADRSVAPLYSRRNAR